MGAKEIEREERRDWESEVEMELDVRVRQRGWDRDKRERQRGVEEGITKQLYYFPKYAKGFEERELSWDLLLGGFRGLFLKCAATEGPRVLGPSDGAQEDVPMRDWASIKQTNSDGQTSIRQTNSNSEGFSLHTYGSSLFWLFLTALTFLTARIDSHWRVPKETLFLYFPRVFVLKASRKG